MKTTMSECQKQFEAWYLAQSRVPAFLEQKDGTYLSDNACHAWEAHNIE